MVNFPGEGLQYALDGTIPVACPSCGRIRLQGRTETWCVPCANVGHDYTLKDAGRLRQMADRNRMDFYYDVADRLDIFAAMLEKS